MSKVTTVTSERKKQLLLEARKDRLSWIQSSKIPYQQFEQDPSDGKDTVQKNPLHPLSSSNIIQSIPSSLKVLDLLLEGTSQEDKHILTKEWNTELRIQTETKRQEELIGSIDDHAFVFYYNEIIERLCLPECKDIVQKMRQFVKSLQDMSSSCCTKDEEMTNMKNTICTFLENLYDTLASHPLWREKDGVLSNDTKMMLDTFVYSKCYKHIRNIMMDKDLESEEQFMTDRLEFLNEFIEPIHLEIPFWNGEFHDLNHIHDKEINTMETSSSSPPWEQHLTHPIALLHSLGKLYSPSQMLRCILDVYRGINDALKNVFLHLDGEKTPSADDILPTLILTVICARPKNIMSILTFVEWFATDEQKRGESGYAFATLYSAMQFIKELDLQPEDEDHDKTKKPTLHMSQTEMKKLLNKYLERKEHTCSDTEKYDAHAPSTDDVPQGKVTSTSSLGTFHPITIPLHEVTAARLRGENLKEWAQRYIDSNHQSSLEQTAISHDDEGKNQTETLHQNEMMSLPDGFNRSYKYLATDPNNVRFADIPGILEEYSMLVKAVETLISERNSFMRHNRKNEQKLKRERLEASLAEIEKDTDSLS